MQQPDWRRYVAPAAFLLAVTIAVVLIRAGMNAGGSTTTTGATATARHGTTVAARKGPTKRYWVVRAGDTFAVISSQTGVSVAKIAHLNPKLSSTSLHIGQRVRIR